MVKRSNNVVVAIPDIHSPFPNFPALFSILDYIRETQPDYVIQLGDLLDQYVFSKYARSLGITPHDEIARGLEIVSNMWEQIKKDSPRSKRIQLLGNHDVRISKRISETIPELEGFFSHKDLYKFKGVTVLDSDKDYFELDGIIYVHGWLSKSLDHAKYFNQPVVHGHRHRPCIEYDHENLWSMDCGYIADRNETALQYTASKYSKWSTTFGVIDHGHPKLIKL